MVSEEKVSKPMRLMRIPQRIPQCLYSTEVRRPFHSRDPGVSRFAPEKITTFHPTLAAMNFAIRYTQMNIFTNTNINKHQTLDQHQTSNWIC